jgi:hypothetical protein
MNPRTVLTIGSVLAALFGLGLALAPREMLAGMGLGAPAEGLVLSRNLGAMLLGISVLNWLARDATGAPLRAVLIGNVAIQVFEFLVNGADLLLGTLPPQAGGGLVLHVGLAVLYGLGLRSASPQPLRGERGAVHGLE